MEISIASIFEKLKSLRFQPRSKVQPQTISTQSKSGQTITEASALKVGAYWACVNLISDLVASLPMSLYRRTDRGREEVKDHWLYHLIHNSPNADMAAYEFKNFMAKSMCVQGNFYALKRYIDDEVIALLHLFPDKVTPYYQGGEKLYDYHNPITGQKETYTDSEILHVPCFGYDGLKGYSPIAYMRDSIGIALSSNELSADSFNNASQFVGAIGFTGNLKPEQKKDLRDSVPAVRNDPLRNILILDGGPTFHSFRISPADLQLIESEQFRVEDVCRWFRVPPHMVGHSNVTTWGSGIEELSLGFLAYTLQPSYISRIEQSYNMRLLPDEMKSEYYFEFKTDALLRSSITAQGEFYSKMLQNGVYSRNEVREFKNMSPIEGGDEYTVQVNMTLLDLLRRANTDANNNER